MAKEFSDDDLVKIQSWKQMYPQLPEYWVEAAYRYCSSTSKPLTNSERRKIRKQLHETYKAINAVPPLPVIETVALPVEDDRSLLSESSMDVDGGDIGASETVDERSEGESRADVALEGPDTGEGVAGETDMGR